MILKNKTPLAVMAFPKVDLDGDPFLVVVAKGIFDIIKDESAKLSEQRASIRIVAVAWEKQTPSSLRYEDDLAPFKVGTDVIVNGTAYAPGGARLPSWRAGLQVGAFKKDVTVTGPRAWVHTPLLGWSLTETIPVQRVPLRYEHAFGGEGFQGNPIGRGHCDVRRADRSRAIEAPQVLTAEGRTPMLGEEYPVEGFSAIVKSWQPRRARAGTFDQEWAAQGGKSLPIDFDGSFWNAAHPDLCLGSFLRGAEDVTLTALHPEHTRLCFRLPSLVVAVGVVYSSGYRHGVPARLDTLLIEPDEMRAELSWRAALPMQKSGIAGVTVAMQMRRAS